MLSEPDPSRDGDRALSFDAVAELYDRVRPAYPEPLLDAVLAFCGEAIEPVLEIGPGTGIASRAFAARGIRLLAVEPGREMARVWRARMPDDSEIRVARFEQSALPGQHFGLVFSGQAFHWVERERRLPEAHRVLRPGGVLAVFGHAPQRSDAPVFRDIDSVYRAHASALAEPEGALAGALGWYAGAGSPFWSELCESPLFADESARSFPFERDLDADHYCDWLRTQSNHVQLPEAQREALLAGIAEAIEAHGGRIVFPIVSTLFLARRVG